MDNSWRVRSRRTMAKTPALRSRTRLTISNTLPTVTNVSIAPVSPVAGDQPTCTYTYSDADNNSDNSTIQWTINGNPSSTTPTLTAAIYGGDTLSCVVTPNDGVGGVGTAQSASVTVQNTAPSVSNVVITPAAPKVTSSLTCSYTYADIDNDPDQSTITWSNQDGATLRRVLQSG